MSVLAGKLIPFKCMRESWDQDAGSVSRTQDSNESPKVTESWWPENQVSGATMGKVNLENLKPGMILAAKVVERGGRILLGVGVELTEKHIGIFRKWGITQADVQNVTQEEAAANTSARLDPRLLQEGEARMARLFHLTDKKEPFIAELSRLCTIRWVRNRTRGRIE